MVLEWCEIQGYTARVGGLEQVARGYHASTCWTEAPAASAECRRVESQDDSGAGGRLGTVVPWQGVSGLRLPDTIPDTHERAAFLGVGCPFYRWSIRRVIDAKIDFDHIRTAVLRIIFFRRRGEAYCACMEQT